MRMTKLSESQLRNSTHEELISMVLHMQKEYMDLEQQLALMKVNTFGRKTEKFNNVGDKNQLTFDDLNLFDNMVEAVADDDSVKEAGQPEEPKQEESDKKDESNKTKKSRKVNLDNLKKVKVVHELTEEELEAIFGKNQWRRLADKVHQKLVVIPAKFYVEEHHVAVYESTFDETKVSAEFYELINNSVLSPSLAASIIYNKYVNRMPLYRIEADYRDHDIEIPRNTLARWIINVCENYLSLITRKFHEKLLEEKVLMSDESPCYVTKDGRSAGSKSFMWVLRTSEFKPQENIVYFSYKPGRSLEDFRGLIPKWSGTLVTDAYSVYDSVDRKDLQITVANCWTHARRLFANVVKTYGPKKAKEDNILAFQALEKIGAIYNEENKLRYLSTEERLKRRNTAVKCKVDKFFDWAKKHENDTGCTDDTSKAFSYCLNNERKLRIFLGNGDVPIDNSASERNIRNHACIRGVWKLIDTVHGAEASATIYSIIETAKANNLKIEEYIEHLLKEIPKHMDDTNYDFLEDLMPWSKKLPDSCKMPSIDMEAVKKQHAIKHNYTYKP